MLKKCGKSGSAPTTSVLRLVRAFGRDRDGVVAIEFALVFTPFLMLMFGAINIGMYYYTVNCIDKGIDDAARYLRTGEAQNGSSYANGNGSTSITAGAFKQLVCDKAAGFLDCNQLYIQIQQSNTDWTAINSKTCDVNNISSGAITTNDSTLISAMAGTATAKVLITACYKYEATKYFFKFLRFDQSFADGSSLIQSSSALQIEPY